MPVTAEALREILMRHVHRTTGDEAAPVDSREARIFIAISVAPPRTGPGPRGADGNADTNGTDNGEVTRGGVRAK